MHGLCKLTETEIKLERNLQVNKTRSLELDLGNLGLEMPQVSVIILFASVNSFASLLKRKVEEQI